MPRLWRKPLFNPLARMTSRAEISLPFDRTRRCRSDRGRCLSPSHERTRRPGDVPAHRVDERVVENVCIDYCASPRRPGRNKRSKPLHRPSLHLRPTWQRLCCSKAESQLTISGTEIGRICLMHIDQHRADTGAAEHGGGCEPARPPPTMATSTQLILLLPSCQHARQMIKECNQRAGDVFRECHSTWSRGTG